MMEWIFLTSIIAGIAAFWSQAKSFAMQAYSHVVVTIECNDVAATAVLGYLQQTARVSRFGLRSYAGWIDFVRPEKRRMAVAAETLGKGTKLYWMGRNPLWIRRTSNTRDERNDNVHIRYQPVSVSFFRGSIEPDQLLNAATNHYNSIRDSEGTEKQRSMHSIQFHSGTEGKPAQLNRDYENHSDNNGLPTSEPNHDSISSMRLLQWQLGDIGPHIFEGSALERMYLCPAAESLIAEVSFWIKSREWHQQRGLTWKRGFGLTSPPGNGKTSLVRAIGEEFDLPIHVFDLATFYNDELRREWQRVQAQAPCIILIDDIDAVYHDREKLDNGPSFDCLLNCLDGVSRADGVLTFITTNRPELLSDALTRPGRIDRMIQMDAPDEAGRRRIASRILADWPDRICTTVDSGTGESGAEFERRCCDLALELFWGGRAAISA